ncbi:MAG: ATP synthase F1 subunit delta, partial [Chlorobium sp.]|nr:ATP synthase F1 subunit delta [Chlorobium sp.]MCW8815458.1 ATP synthase F1 subunit delta [Chlorobium sp.]
MSSNIASRRYAKALLDVAEEGDYVDQMAEDLVVVSETVAGSRDLLNMLRSPIVKGDLKARILKEVFKDAVSDKTIRLFDLLCRKKRAGLLADVIEDFSALRDVRGGIVNVDVT